MSPSTPSLHKCRDCQGNFTSNRIDWDQRSCEQCQTVDDMVAAGNSFEDIMASVRPVSFPESSPLFFLPLVLPSFLLLFNTDAPSLV